MWALRPAGSAPNPVCFAAAAILHRAARNSPFPQRPDADVLSNSISPFFIGQDKHGFWVARELEGRNWAISAQTIGGAFRQRETASQRDAQRCSSLNRLSLDIENEGNRTLALLGAAAEVVARRAPGIADFIGSVVTEWRKLVTQISNACAGQRRHREVIERELFRGQYTLCSKNDDDLPIP